MDKFNVLIVDDDPMVAQVNKGFTNAVPGFEVVGCASNGLDALSMLSSLQVDLVVLDIYMPKLDGIEVLAKIRQSGYEVDVLMVTAANNTATISSAFRSGVVGYIIKPFKFERFQSTLENYREMKLKLKNKSYLNQTELDKLMSENQTKDSLLPKNLHKATLTNILDFLCTSSDALSAEEVAAGTGLSRATTRRYLEYLSSVGSVELLLEYISVGRPTNRYKIKDLK
jgi:two-component system response regulator DctR